MTFTSELFSLINDSLRNNHLDNWDQIRFGQKPTDSFLNKVKYLAKDRLSRGGYFRLQYIINNAEAIDTFKYLYDLLELESDKKLLLQLLVYRILGHTKVKLPTNTAAYSESIRLIESNYNTSDFIDTGFLDFRLYNLDLSFLNVPIKMYANALGCYIDFVLKQYEYHNADIHIEAKSGDVVIDAGGCYGDTALYFANKVGSNGAVHVFEFIPDNIKLLNRNVEQNPLLKENIQLVDRPVWSITGKDVFYKANGPGSFVAMEPFDGYNGKTTTLSIDDYVLVARLDKVDMIKMDIEGAENNALAGAIETIRRFKPKLAIALYHSVQDFESIPKFINDLNLGYKFYLLHATIHTEETMLFAIAK